MNKQIEELKSHLDTMIGNSSQLKAEKLVKLGYRRQSELLIKDFKSNNSEVMSNKQIEEMAKDMCDCCRADVILKDLPCEDNICEGVRKHAESLYNAGYRKQSEGEWEIVKGSNGKEKMVCTNCRHGQDLHSTFTYCPNCGARMHGAKRKGGAE